MKKANLFMAALLSLSAEVMLASCTKTAEPEPVIQSIAVSGEYKTEYVLNEEFDATGIVVTATYDKGEAKDVTAETIFSGFNSSAVGPVVVTATYLEKTAEINLTVFLSPEAAITEVASCWGGSVGLVEEGVYGTYGAFSAASYSVAVLKSYVPYFVPEEFKLVSNWAADASGMQGCVYANAVSTVLEFYVYAETLYVDASGHIVEEGTEGATAVEATCIKVYSFTETKQAE